MKTKTISWIKLALPAFLLLTICFIDIPPSFTNLLAHAQMTFDTPNGFEETAIIKNKQMNYNYALKLPGHNFEVRYTVRPLDTLQKQYEAMKKNQQPGTVMAGIEPNKLYAMSFRAILFNISGGRAGDIKLFPADAVKKEFNADWGATGMVPLAPEFGQNYKDCMVIAIHKDNIGDAYYFYMITDREDVKLIPSIFHALKFK